MSAKKYFTAEEKLLARRARQKEYRKRYPERVRAVEKRCRAKHPERGRAAHKRWKSAHPEKLRQLQRDYIKRCQFALALLKTKGIYIAVNKKGECYVKNSR